MEIVVGVLKSKIKTDNPKLLKALVDLYTFQDQNAFFSPAYKRGYWDGKKRFISKTGIFSTGLLDNILADLKKIECDPKITLKDHPGYIRGFNEVPAKIDGFDYYDFQSNLIHNATYQHRGIIKSPTGSGKTLILAGLLKTIDTNRDNAVILFNAKQLLKQTYDFLENCGFTDLGICFGEGFIPGRIMLCTVQSIEKIIDTHLDSARYLFVDEVHEFANGKTTLAAINSFPKAVYRFGFTATVPSKDIPKNNLIGAFGPVIEAVSTSALVEEGKLTKPVIQLIKIMKETPLDGTYREVYEEAIVENNHRNDIIAKVVDKIRERGECKILIIVQSLKHGRILNELIPDSDYLEGEDSIETRYDTINKFRKRKKSVLIGTKILQTGVNIEEVTHLINARGMKSDIATLQALGRALRRHDSKDKVYIYDFLDNAKYLRAHSLARKKHYYKEGHEVILLNEN